MVVITDPANGAVGELKILILQRVSTTHDSIVEGNEVFLKEARAIGFRQPARLGICEKNKIGISAGRDEPLVKIAHCLLMYLAIWLDDNRHADACQAAGWTGGCSGLLHFVFDHLRRYPNIPHLFHFFWRELQAELLFQRQNEVEVLRGVPGVDRLWRRL